MNIKMMILGPSIAGVTSDNPVDLISIALTSLEARDVELFLVLV